MHCIISIIRVIFNEIRFMFLRLSGANVVSHGMCTSRLNNEWSVSKDSMLEVGNHFSSLDHCRILVRSGKLIIGKNVGLNSNCIVGCHSKIEICDGVEIGPNVCIYDHDHDFRCDGGIKSKNFICSDVYIGENTWIGANTLILKGTHIGANCVIAGGSVVFGNIPENSIFVQKRSREVIGYGSD